MLFLTIFNLFRVFCEINLSPNVILVLVLLQKCVIISDWQETSVIIGKHFYCQQIRRCPFPPLSGGPMSIPAPTLATVSQSKSEV